MITSGGKRKPAKPDLDAGTLTGRRRISPACSLAVIRRCNSALAVPRTPLRSVAGKSSRSVASVIAVSPGGQPTPQRQVVRQAAGQGRMPPAAEALTQLNIFN